MNYIIGQVSGKQFLFKQNRWYDLDFIKTVKSGDFIYLNKILLFKKNEKIQIGQPFLVNSKLPVTILQEKVKGKKIVVLKTKPKKKYTRTRGHRQLFTRIKIN